jgi:hypothetical protein
MSKPDLNDANSVHKDQFKINAGGKDLVTKTTLLISTLWYLHKLVILTSDYMSLSLGQRDSRHHALLNQ